MPSLAAGQEMVVRGVRMTPDAQEVLLAGIQSPHVTITYLFGSARKVIDVSCIDYWRSPLSGSIPSECTQQALSENRRFCVDTGYQTLVAGQLMTQAHWDSEYGRQVCTCEAAMQATRSWCEPVANAPVVRVALTSSLEGDHAVARSAVQTANAAEQHIISQIGKVEQQLRDEVQKELVALRKRLDDLEAARGATQRQGDATASKATQ
jgi:hypothetical protein